MILILLSLLQISYSQTNVCESLSNFACAPGKYKDGTGQVPSESELRKNRDEQKKATRLFLDAEFKKVLNSPDNDFFKESALQSFGLTDAPMCNSKDLPDIKDCDDNLIEGLSELAIKSSFHTDAQRLGDLEAVSTMMENHIFKDILDRSKDKVEKGLQTDPLIAKIKTQTVPQIKNLFVRKINALALGAEQKKLMTSKIKSVSFSGDDCGKRYGENINALFVPNAYYNSLSHTFSYCSGLAIRSSSDFTLGTIVAHELAHSIDPCRLPMGLSARKQFGVNENKDSTKTVADLDMQTPFKNLITCLRDKKSIAAQNIPLHEAVDGYGAPARPGDNDIKNEAPPKTLCNDQITESFCDWMAAEVLSDFIKNNHKLTTAQYINGYGNAFRPICSSRTNSNGGDNKHPITADRIDKIMLMNPSVRKDMGCPPNHSENIYCTPDTVIGDVEVGKTPDTGAEGRIEQ
jgi:hypothetical protein